MMSKLIIKNKFFFAGLGMMMTLALSFAGNVSAQTYMPATVFFHIGTLRIGMSGSSVANLQAALNSVNASMGGPMLAVDGRFGPATLSAVRFFQSNYGLAADGVVGPRTGAALAAATPGTGPIGGFLLGCAPGYSFSPTTGQPCGGTGGTNLPPGCTSTFGYSPITGARCDGSIITPPPPPRDGDDGGSLQGGAGSLDEADFVSGLNNEQVGEGENDVEVLGLDLSADNNSDLRINTVRVEFEEQGAGGSDDFDNYAEEATIWFNDRQVGSTDVEDMSESGGVWSKTISLSGNTIIRRGDTESLTVAVSALNNIDSADLGSGNNDWEASVTSIRYEDADGVTLTESSVGDIGVGRPFYFTEFSTAADVELTVSESEDNPERGTVQVDEGGGDEVTLLRGEIEAQGSDLDISELTLVAVPGGASVEEISARFILMIDGDEVDSLDADECDDVAGNCSNDDGQAATYLFQDFDLTIGEGDTVELEVRAELNDFAGDYGQGDSLSASVDSEGIEAEDESGDSLGGNEKNGSAVGEVQTFQSEGLSAELVSAEADDQSAGQNKVVGKYTFVIDITSNEGTFWIDEDGSVSVNATLSDADANITSINLDSSDATLTANNNFRISNGQTRRFTVEVFADMDTGQEASVRATLDSLEYKTSDDDAPDADATISLGSPTYRSGAVYLITP